MDIGGEAELPNTPTSSSADCLPVDRSHTLAVLS